MFCILFCFKITETDTESFEQVLKPLFLNSSFSLIMMREEEVIFAIIAYVLILKIMYCAGQKGSFALDNFYMREIIIMLMI